MALILIIDDNPERVSTIDMILCEKHKVLSAPDGEKGLAALAQNPEIIFLDYNMPEMNGFEFSRQIKTNPKYQAHAQIPIIGIGSFPDEERGYLMECLRPVIDEKEILRCVIQYCQ